MPIVRIDLLEGREPERKEELIRRVTEVIAETLDLRPDQVRVLLYELPPAHWAVGGKSKAQSMRETTEDARLGQP